MQITIDGDMQWKIGEKVYLKIDGAQYCGEVVGVGASEGATRKTTYAVEIKNPAKLRYGGVNSGN